MIHIDDLLNNLDEYLKDKVEIRSLDSNRINLIESGLKPLYITRGQNNIRVVPKITNIIFSFSSIFYLLSYIGVVFSIKDIKKIHTLCNKLSLLMFVEFYDKIIESVLEREKHGYLFSTPTTLCRFPIQKQETRFNFNVTATINNIDMKQNTCTLDIEINMTHDYVSHGGIFSSDLLFDAFSIKYLNISEDFIEQFLMLNHLILFNNKEKDILFADLFLSDRT